MSEFNDEVITDIEVKKKRELDNFLVHLQTDTVIITTLIKYLDENDNELRSSEGKTFIYRDTEEPACTDFTTFMQKIGLTKAIVKQAIEEMEAS